jgi:hypothetical protein
MTLLFKRKSYRNLMPRKPCPRCKIGFLTRYGYCKRCKESKGIRDATDFLNLHGIIYAREHRVGDTKLSFDIWIPDIKCAIEYDGIQHVKPKRRYGGLDGLIKTIIRDEQKDQWCKDNGASIIRIGPGTRPDLLRTKVSWGTVATALYKPLYELYSSWTHLKLNQIIISTASEWKQKKIKAYKPR